MNDDAPMLSGETVVVPPVPLSPPETEPHVVEPPAAPVAVEEAPVVHALVVTPVFLPLEQLEAGDRTFCIRPAEELEDVAALATDLARLGQLFPIDVRVLGPERFQLVAGFRRVAALRFLQREKVLARVHSDLSNADATLMSLASAIHSKTVGLDALSAKRAALEESGQLTPVARDLLDRALSPENQLAPEQVEEEVDADELAADVTMRLGQCNQDLSLLADVFGELDEGRKNELLTQLRYSVDLVSFLESKQ